MRNVGPLAVNPSSSIALAILVLYALTPGLTVYNAVDYPFARAERPQYRVVYAVRDRHVPVETGLKLPHAVRTVLQLSAGLELIRRLKEYRAVTKLQV